MFTHFKLKFRGTDNKEKKSLTFHFLSCGVSLQTDGVPQVFVSLLHCKALNYNYKLLYVHFLRKVNNSVSFHHKNVSKQSNKDLKTTGRHTLFWRNRKRTIVSLWLQRHWLNIVIIVPLHNLNNKDLRYIKMNCLTRACLTAMLPWTEGPAKRSSDGRGSPEDVGMKWCPKVCTDRWLAVWDVLCWNVSERMCRMCSVGECHKLCYTDTHVHTHSV